MHLHLLSTKYIFMWILTSIYTWRTVYANYFVLVLEVLFLSLHLYQHWCSKFPQPRVFNFSICGKCGCWSSNSMFWFGDSGWTKTRSIPSQHACLHGERRKLLQQRLGRSLGYNEFGALTIMKISENIYKTKEINISTFIPYNTNLLNFRILHFYST